MGTGFSRTYPGPRKCVGKRQLLCVSSERTVPSSPAKSNRMSTPLFLEGSDLLIMQLSRSLASHPVLRILSLPHRWLESKVCFGYRRKGNKVERIRSIHLLRQVQKLSCKDDVWFPREERGKRNDKNTQESSNSRVLSTVITSVGYIKDFALFLIHPEQLASCCH